MIFILLLALCVAISLGMCMQYFVLMPDPTEHDGSATIEKVSIMHPEDRHEYYSDLFRRIGNEVELTTDQIITLPPSDPEDPSETKEGDDNGDNDDNWEEDPSQYLSLGADPSIPNSSSSSSSERRRSSFVALRRAENQTTMVRGTCIICFEPFRAGDTIVHSSETKSCPHVYHKACMVDYLSAQHPARSTGDVRDHNHDHDHDPSCPTCRQPFCRLLPLGGEGLDDDCESQRTREVEEIDSETRSNDDETNSTDV
eukprot:jgi/Psemu1/284908/fgenesh1_pg.67_\